MITNRETKQQPISDFNIQAIKRLFDETEKLFEHGCKLLNKESELNELRELLRPYHSLTARKAEFSTVLQNLTKLWRELNQDRQHDEICRLREWLFAETRVPTPVYLADKIRLLTSERDTAICATDTSIGVLAFKENELDTAVKQLKNAGTLRKTEEKITLLKCEIAKLNEAANKRKSQAEDELRLLKPLLARIKEQTLPRSTIRDLQALLRTGKIDALNQKIQMLEAKQKKQKPTQAAIEAVNTLVIRSNRSIDQIIDAKLPHEYIGADRLKAQLLICIRDILRYANLILQKHKATLDPSIVMHIDPLPDYDSVDPHHLLDKPECCADYFAWLKNSIADLEKSNSSTAITDLVNRVTELEHAIHAKRCEYQHAFFLLLAQINLTIFAEMMADLQQARVHRKDSLRLPVTVISLSQIQHNLDSQLKSGQAKTPLKLTTELTLCKLIKQALKDKANKNAWHKATTFLPRVIVIDNVKISLPPVIVEAYKNINNFQELVAYAKQHVDSKASVTILQASLFEPKSLPVIFFLGIIAIHENRVTLTNAKNALDVITKAGRDYLPVYSQERKMAKVSGPVVSTYRKD